MDGNKKTSTGVYSIQDSNEASCSNVSLDTDTQVLERYALFPVYFKTDMLLNRCDEIVSLLPNMLYDSIKRDWESSVKLRFHHNLLNNDSEKTEVAFIVFLLKFIR